MQSFVHYDIDFEFEEKMNELKQEPRFKSRVKEITKMKAYLNTTHKLVFLILAEPSFWEIDNSRYLTILHSNDFAKFLALVLSK
jgi:hypothetical protein